MQVIPSLDVSNVSDLITQIERLIPFYQRFQIDFADGIFVDFATPPLISLLETITPFKELEFDFHLMTADYQKALNEIKPYNKIIKIPTIFVHHGATPPPDLFLEPPQPYNYGLILNPDDSIDTIEHVYDLPRIENIQIMSIIPGPQGNPFIPFTINKIDQLRELGYKHNIFLDGGINKDSLEIIKNKKYHPDYICPGSFFSRAENVEDRVQYLTEVFKDENNPNQNS
ncbi:MAG: hypothetical protein WAT72_04545 [Microgenomates group bacterium]|jgi:pentose-5-phosphate-3-epimerase|nr:hypothetical protein [Candidatus Woesebacteria bacterium]MBP6883201.1 hypothetical protein [Candidatus Woesebacteria bacterium]